MNTERNPDPSDLSLLKLALDRTYKERFEMITRLYKVQMTLKKARVSHKPFIKK